MLKRMLPTRNAGSRTALSAPLAEIHGTLHAAMHAEMYAKIHGKMHAEMHAEMFATHEERGISNRAKCSAR